MDTAFKTHLKELLEYCTSPSDSPFREEEAGDGSPLSNDKLGYQVTSEASRSLQLPLILFICEVIISNTHHFLHIIDLHLSFSWERQRKCFSSLIFFVVLLIFSFILPQGTDVVSLLRSVLHRFGFQGVFFNISADDLATIVLVTTVVNGLPTYLLVGNYKAGMYQQELQKEEEGW